MIIPLLFQAAAPPVLLLLPLLLPGCFCPAASAPCLCSCLCSCCLYTAASALAPCSCCPMLLLGCCSGRCSNDCCICGVHAKSLHRYLTLQIPAIIIHFIHLGNNALDKSPAVGFLRGRESGSLSYPAVSRFQNRNDFFVLSL